MRMLSESKLTFDKKIVYAEGILIRHLLCRRLRKCHLLLLREGFTQKIFIKKVNAFAVVGICRKIAFRAQMW